MTDLADTVTPKNRRSIPSHCDREPIHMPGTIQSHGVLLVLQEPDLKIVQVSANAESLLSISPKELLLSPLSLFLADECAHLFSVENLEANSSLRGLAPLAITTQFGLQRTRWDGLLHRSQGLLLLELERSPERDQKSISSFAHQAQLALSQLQGSLGLKDVFELAAREVKKVTGFDRVMVYRFDKDGHGEIVAEEKEERLEPFLGLHFPATDIPKPARALLEKNRLRLIPNIDFKPSAILTGAHSIPDNPLDLSFSVLKGVSPLHCEYLRNMGVKASMTISLLRDGKLWGLITCHHYQSEKLVPYEVRSICELLGQMFSWQLTSQIVSDENDQRVVAKNSETKLVLKMSAESNFVHGLVKSEDLLLKLTEASGAAISYEDEIYLIGNTPSLEQVQGLVGWLKNVEDDELVFQTSCLTDHYPPAETFKDVASGMLSISISRTQGEFLIWFRPELIETVNWAGNPKKASETNEAGKLSPRKSFALWRDSVRLTSPPWRSWQVEAAQDIRGAILGVIVKTASEIKRLNSDLTRAIQARDDFLSVASHELKTPLTILQFQVQTLLRSAKRDEGDLSRDRVLPKLELVNLQAIRLTQLIENLMDVSRIRVGQFDLSLQKEVSLSDLVIRIADAHQLEYQSAHRLLNTDVQPRVTGHWDAVRLGQIVTNLLSNALKYGGTKPVELTLRANEKQAVIRVKDQGIGIALEKTTRIFNRFERAAVEHNFSGLGLGLWIVRQITDAMGGKISVQSELGKGSEFILELPRNSPDSEEVSVLCKAEGS